MELLRHADGIFSEDGDALLNSIGLSTISMPAIGWTRALSETAPEAREAGGGREAASNRHHPLQTSKNGRLGCTSYCPIDDAYMQHHLRMGVAPTAPAYGSDHSLADDNAAVNQLYKDYGPLFQNLRGSMWGG